MKLTVVEIGGCRPGQCGLCEDGCSKNSGAWERLKSRGNDELGPCTVGYYLTLRGTCGTRGPQVARRQE